MKTGSRERFWERVNDILDQRGDPYEDRDIRSHLMDHPEDLEELASLCSRLERLERVVPAPVRKTVRPWLTLAAAGVVGFFLLILWDPDSSRPGIEEAPVAQAGVILEFSCKFTVTTAEGEEIFVRNGDRWTARQTKVIEGSEGFEHGSIGPTSIVCVDSGRDWPDRSTTSRQ